MTSHYLSFFKTYRPLVLLSLLIVFLYSCKSKLPKENTLEYEVEEIDTVAQQTTELSSEKEAISLEKIIGERIDGPANFRKDVNGKVIFSLEDNVLIEATASNNAWSQIGLYVQLTKKEMEDFYILPGKNLLDESGKNIGKTIDTVEIQQAYKNLGQIVAFTKFSNIKQNTVPENNFLKILDKNKLTKIDFKAFFTTYNFKRLENSDKGREEWYIYENSIDDPSPQDRLTLLFENENLLGFVHSRSIKHANFKTYPLIRGHYLSVPSATSKSKIDALVAEKNQFYNSVD